MTTNDAKMSLHPESGMPGSFRNMTKEEAIGVVNLCAAQFMNTSVNVVFLAI